MVAGGILDARSAANALHGIDSSLHYFIALENAELGALDIPLPVKIQEGSWEALIPDDILGWIKAIGGIAGIVGTTYLSAAAAQLAQNDFKDVTTKQILQKALKSIQNLISIGTHLGNLKFRNITGPTWDKEGMIGIRNAKGEILYIPIHEFRKIESCPENILSKMASVVEEERTLVVGIRVGGLVNEVALTRKDRHIFYTDENDTEEPLFPDLTHGKRVALKGTVTRENGRANTLGFLYENHVLTCIPANGQIIPYKKHLFLHCLIKGTISRLDEKGRPIATRPKVIFDDLEILSDKEQLEFEGIDYDQ